MITASTYGAPNWVDLATTDVLAATDFYRDMFGWEIEKTTTPMGDYFVGNQGPRQVAGMMTIPSGEEMPPAWTTFIYVEDVDATVGLVREAEGSVLEEPFDLPDGRVAIVADPGGGMFGVISGVPAEGTWLAPEAGCVSWVELLTRDTAAAETFYRRVFDWKAETQLYGTTSYTTFSLDDEPVAGMMTMPAEMGEDVPPHWSIYFTVADCGEAATTAEELGGVVLRPAQAIEMGHFAVLADPQGGVFNIMDYETRES